MMPSTYTPIVSTTLSSTQTNITLTSIPSTYTDLVLVVYAAFDSIGDIRFRFNSDATASYSGTLMWGYGATTGSVRATGTSVFGDSYGAVGSVLGNSCQIYDIMDYADTSTYKTILGRSVNVSNTGVDVSVNLWSNTAAISSITFGKNSGMGGTFQIGSTITLYGIKAA